MRGILLVVFLGGLFLLALQVWAGESATQTVLFEVRQIDELAVSGSPQSLIVEGASAGLEPEPVEDRSTFYAITTNDVNQKITARLDREMPAGTELRLELNAPRGAIGKGAVRLGVSAEELVTSISQAVESDLGITYIFSASRNAGAIAQQDRTVVFTLTSP